MPSGQRIVYKQDAPEGEQLRFVIIAAPEVLFPASALEAAWGSEAEPSRLRTTNTLARLTPTREEERPSMRQVWLVGMPWCPAYTAEMAYRASCKQQRGVLTADCWPN